jgi:hypothetical protein
LVPATSCGWAVLRLQGPLLLLRPPPCLSLLLVLCWRVCLQRPQQQLLLPLLSFQPGQMVL